MSFCFTSTGSFVWLYIAVVISFPVSSFVFNFDVSTTGALLYEPSAFFKYSEFSIFSSLLTATMNFLKAKSNDCNMILSKSSSSSYLTHLSGSESLSVTSFPFASVSADIHASFLITVPIFSDVTLNFTEISL